MIHGTGQKRCGERSAEMIVGIAIDAVDEDEGASNFLVLRFKRIIAVDQESR